MSLGFTVAGFGVESSGTPIASSYEAETLAHIARMTGTYNEALNSDINDLILSIKAASLWAKIDQLIIQHNIDSQSDCLLNLKGVNDAVISGAIQWTASEGFKVRTGDGAYIESGIAIGGSGLINTSKNYHILPYIQKASDLIIDANYIFYTYDFVGGYITAVLTREGDVMGAELITNGDFVSDISSWNTRVTGSGNVAWNSGLMRFNFTATALATCEATQNVSTVIGEAYKVSHDWVKGNSIYLNIGTTQYGAEIGSYSVGPVASGTQNIYFIATSTTTYITFLHQGSSASASGTEDNVSVKLSEEKLTIIGLILPQFSGDMTSGALLGVSRNDTEGYGKTQIGATIQKTSISSVSLVTFSDTIKIGRGFTSVAGNMNFLGCVIGGGLTDLDHANIAAYMDTYMAARGLV